MKNLLNTLKENSKLSYFAGIILILMGVLSISLPFFSGIAVASMVSISIIVYGVSVAAFAFGKDSLFHICLSFFAGLLITMFGWLMLVNPAVNLQTLSLIAVSYFIVEGIMGLISTYELRHAKVWGWSLFNALISLSLATLLIAQWPASSLFIVGTLVGVRFMFSGFNIIFLTSSSADLAKTISNESNVINNAQHA